MKKLIFLFINIFIVSNIFGQNENKIIETSKPFEYYFNTGVGYYLPIRSSKFLSDRGSNYTFNFQINYKNNYFTRIFFDMSIIKYKKNNIVFNNTLTNIDQKLNTNNIGLDFGYIFQRKKIYPFFYCGIGVAFTDTPTLKKGFQDNEIIYQTNEKNYFLFRSGLGIDYKISRFLIPYLEIEYSSTAFHSVLDNLHLQGVSLTLGFKTEL